MNKIALNLTYFTNFKPNLLLSDEFNFEINNKQNAIFCKNFLIFILLMRTLAAKKNINISLFVKPQKKSLQTLLRPPYRHKLSRHQLTIHRFFIAVKFQFILNSAINITNLDQLYFFISEIKKYYSFFETNICYLHRSKIQFFMFYDSFFLLRNMK